MSPAGSSYAGPNLSRFARAGGKHVGWYYYGDNAGNASVAAMVDGTEYAATLVWNGQAIDRIGIETTVGVASAIRLGIRADLNGLPGAVMLDAGTVDGSLVQFSEVTVALRLPPGIYWLSATAQGGGPTTRATGVGGNTSYGASNPLAISGGSLIGYTQAGVAGALPALFVPANNGGNTPRVLVRSAA